MSNNKKICFLRAPLSTGGPSTFQINFTNYFKSRGFTLDICNRVDLPDVIFVISGTRSILKLILQKARGVFLVQRLDGLDTSEFKNKSSSTFVKFKHFIRLCAIHFIRTFLADVVVYQSSFVESCWIKYPRFLDKNNDIVIPNTANQKFFDNQIYKRSGNVRVICVEGAVKSDSLSSKLLGLLDSYVQSESGLITSIDIYGAYDQINTSEFPSCNFHGVISRDEVPKLYSSDDRIIFVVLERYPPCPNSVIEAIASGVPIIGFKEGSLPELVDNAGSLIPNNLSIDELHVSVYNALYDISMNYDFYHYNSVRNSARFSYVNIFSLYEQVITKLS